MFLSKLEILGFKSFQQKTVVKFSAGMTGIVGPNGCGKTNIVDALRWCLGEQKSSTLRSDKMENVIFNGTANKKPMGMAEVSLTILNDKGILPSEYSEVTITRRIFRSGESEYLLNKNLCRLKDITNLFMDTGMGANAYSVIELKMVESILNNKTDERRTMFEEAAGVNKYKLRRRLTLKKLDEVKADLTRVNDIVAEVEKKVASLERQAKRTDKYTKLSSVLRELEVDLMEREYALFAAEKAATKDKREQAFSQKIQVESDVNRLDDELKEVKERLRQVEEELDRKRKEIAGQTEKAHKVQQNISVTEERIKALEQNISRFSREIGELKAQYEATVNKIAEDKEAIIVAENDIQNSTEQKVRVESELSAFRTELDEKRSLLNEKNLALIELHKQLSVKENTLRNRQSTLKSIQQNIEKLNSRIQVLTGSIAKTVKYIEELTQEKDETEKKLKESENLYHEKQQEKSTLESELVILRNKELDQRSIINALRNKINFLTNVIENLEGFSKGAKALLENSQWNKGEKHLLANIGNVKEDFRFAIEAALKNDLNNIIVETLEDVQKGIRYLEENDFGKAAFYIYDEKSAPQGFLAKVNAYFRKRAARKLEKEKGFIGWASSFISSSGKWEQLLNRVLEGHAVIDNLENAFALSMKYKGFHFTTLNGDVILPDGCIEGGAAPKLDDTLFGRRQMLEDLKKEFPIKEAALTETQKNIEFLEKKFASIDLKSLADTSRILINDLANIEKQIGQFEFEKKKTMDEIEKIRTELAELVHGAADLEKLITSANTEVQEFAESLKAKEAEKVQFEQDFRLAEEKAAKTQNQLNILNISIERRSGEKNNLNNAVKRGEESLEQIRRTISKREEDINIADQEKITLADSLENLKKELEQILLSKSQLMEEESGIYSRYNEVKTDITAKEKSQSELRKERDRLSNDIYSFDIKLNEIELKTNNLAEHAKDSYSIQLELKEFEDNTTFDFTSRSNEVSNYKQQIKNLGPVNFLAYSEYEEEKQRLDFLHKQRNDLIDSEKDLIKTIEEINSTAKALFMETFEKIRDNFIRIFRTLFNPGDEADLKLEENADPLEGKIEIIAKPKGKRPTSIELLSGGEKTLTAIALLFAIYLVKPSPFCILDEIDAPLDDANIDRFTNIIREFSKNTQFIVVTHNKRTMEAADALYGVTMQEMGVSKLVSVKFDGDMNIEG